MVEGPWPLTGGLRRFRYFYLVASLPYVLTICTLAEGNEKDYDSDYNDFSNAGYCSGMSQNLGDGCTISDDCSTITCKMNFVEKPITFKLKV